MTHFPQVLAYSGGFFYLFVFILKKPCKNSERRSTTSVLGQKKCFALGKTLLQA